MRYEDFIRNVNHSATEQKSATAVKETWEKLDHVLSYLGAEELLDEFVRALDDQEANETLDFIMQMHEIPGVGEESEEELED